jgi:flagellar protein FliO/FliZ
MKKIPLLLAAALLIPAGANAAGDGGPDIAGSLAQMVGSLILVIGIILLLYYLAGKFLKVQRSGVSGYIRVVETKHLAPKKSLVLVEVGGEYLLLSSSGEGVTFIKQVEMLEEIEVVPEKGCADLIPVQLKKKLQSLTAELPIGATARLAQFKKSGGFA